MRLHNDYLMVISVLFAVVFAIMIYSLIRHRQSMGVATTRFSGPTGRVQWLWTLVPMAILGTINIALIEHHESRPAAAQRIERPVAPTHRAATSSQQAPR